MENKPIIREILQSGKGQKYICVPKRATHLEKGDNVRLVKVE